MSKRKGGLSRILYKLTCFVITLCMMITNLLISNVSSVQASVIGNISTIAGTSTDSVWDGGPAASAKLDQPKGVAVDSIGNVYIADTANNRIRKVNASDGTINTIAGTGEEGYSGDGGAAASAELDQPDGVAVDSTGNVYIVDTANNRIRKVNASDGTINTIAGTGEEGYSGDGGTATSAKLYMPEGVAVDSSGNVYIADLANNRIRKVNVSDGTINTIAGTGEYGYSGDGGAATSAELAYPFGIAVDSTGNVYFADRNNSFIRKISASNGMINTIAGTELYSPEGIAVDSTGNLYIADPASYRIYKVNASNGIISTIAGTGKSGYYSGDGGVATGAGLNNPTGVAVDSTGNVYIADSRNNRIRKVNASDGMINTIAGTTTCFGDGGPAINAVLSNPNGVAVDSLGNVYIADRLNNCIRKINASDGKINTVVGTGIGGYTGDGGAATNAELFLPNGIALDSTGNMYIADYGNKCIRKVNASDGKISTIAAHLHNISGVAVDNTGNVYISDSGYNCIYKVNAADGKMSIIAGNGTDYTENGILATNAILESPGGVAVDSLGNVYIADTNDFTIRKVTASDGMINDIAGFGIGGYTGDGGLAIDAELWKPEGVAVDSANNVYIADTGNGCIRKVTASDGIISTIAGTGKQGYIGDGGPATSAELYMPMGVAIDSKGNVYIADSGNECIRFVCFSNSNSTYTVTYNGNGNIGGSVPNDSSTYNEGATVTVLGNTGNLAKTGYTFAGWNTAADGSGTNYAAGATLTIGAANITLYAQWTSDLICIGFNPSNYTVNENGGSAVLTVVRDSTTAGATTVDYATSDGTAAAGKDYTAVNGTLSFEDGESSKTITVPIIDEGIYDGSSKNFTVNLSNPSSGSITTGAATVIINDNDSAPQNAAPQIGFNPTSYTVNENGETAALTVMRATTTAGATTVDYATSDGTAASGKDYTTVSGTLSFADGETSKTITVPITDEGIYDGGSKSFTVNLSNPSSGSITTGAATVIINDNDSAPHHDNSGSSGSSTSPSTPSAPTARQVSIERLSGNDRYGTAVAISTKERPKSDNVILASGTDYADALASVTLSYLKNCPILLTGKNKLNDDTLKEIQRLCAKNIYIIGGTGVISDDIENSLKQGYTVERIAGTDRYKTAAAVGEKLKSQVNIDTAVITSGSNFPDALAIAPFAGKRNMPVLYTGKDTLNSDTENMLKQWGIKNVVITGGTGVISQNVEDYIKNTMGIGVKRISGSNRYLTSLEIAKYYSSNYNYDGIVVATGDDYADALTGSIFAANKGYPVLLVSKDSVEEDILNYLRDLKVNNVYILGGSGAVSEGVKTKIYNVYK